MIRRQLIALVSGALMVVFLLPTLADDAKYRVAGDYLITCSETASIIKPNGDVIPGEMGGFGTISFDEEGNLTLSQRSITLQSKGETPQNYVPYPVQPVPVQITGTYSFEPDNVELGKGAGEIYFDPPGSPLPARFVVTRVKDRNVEEIFLTIACMIPLCDNPMDCDDFASALVRTHASRLQKECGEDCD